MTSGLAVILAASGLMGLPLARAQSSVQATVTAQLLNVHETPGNAAPILGQYPQNTVLNVTGRDAAAYSNGSWVYGVPLEGGIAGWVWSGYLQFPAGFDLSSLPITSASGGSTVPPAGGTVPAAVTVRSANFRSGPGTPYPVIRLLPAQTPVTPTGRTADNAWVQAEVDGQCGWLYAPLLSLPVAIDSLPVAASPALPAATTGIPDGVIPVITPHSREIYQRGQQLGNRASAFSKVGDSITHTQEFLFPIGAGMYNLGQYTSLQATIDFFSRPENSFGRYSLSARAGWTSFDLLKSGGGDPSFCGTLEAPLECEYRVFRPSVALIMIGTNDISQGFDTAVYRANLERIVQISIDRGVIPVLSTIPDNLTSAAAGARVLEFNAIVIGVAAQYDIPLWDYWRAMQNLPNKGMGSDNYHPSYNPVTDITTSFTPEWMQYGYTMRNLTALMVLDAVKNAALY